MKALCWHGTDDVRVDTVPTRRSRPADAIIKITSTAICGSDLHLFDGFMPTMENGDILGHEPMGEVVEVGSAVKKLKSATAWSSPSPSPAASASSARRGSFPAAKHESQRGDGSDGDGPVARRPLRLLAHAGRVPRRPGGVPARPVRRRRPDQDSRRHPRRAGPLPLRHFPDRLHGGGELPRSSRRHGGGLGLRAGRPVRHPERLDARRRAGDRDRPRARTLDDGARTTARPRRSTSTRRRSTTADGDDERARPGPLHRRGRLRGPRAAAASTRCSTRSRRP